jgi:hypothetical protein
VVFLLPRWGGAGALELDDLIRRSLKSKRRPSLGQFLFSQPELVLGTLRAHDLPRTVAAGFRLRIIADSRPEIRGRSGGSSY